MFINLCVYSALVCIKFPYEEYKDKLCFEFFMNIFRELGYDINDIEELEGHYNRYKDDVIDTDYYYVYIHDNKYIHGSIIAELWHDDNGITFEIPYEDFCEYNAMMDNSGLPF